ncbi:MAG: hypothetical protein E6Q97_29875 [Desulfurellales bacterium]|nr:MAG: hypothetical protein E6Q97_29875 [Desulfurellales bacterium]
MERLPRPREYTMGRLRVEIAEECEDGDKPHPQTAKFYKACFWYAQSMLDYVIDDIAPDTDARWQIETAIGEAIEGRDLHDNAARIGRLMIELAQVHVTRDYDELVDDLINAEVMEI